MTNSYISPEQYTDLVNEILDEFDFERVRDTMRALNWSWHTIGIPALGDLRRQARKLLTDLADLPDGVIATGGFEASRIDGYPKLQFIVADWDTYPW